MVDFFGLALYRNQAKSAFSPHNWQAVEILRSAALSNLRSNAPEDGQAAARSHPVMFGKNARRPG
jgi:hypothetical protein